ncbi:MAG: LuxR C-terminal-related transcriptional regulator, partial [Gaiellaceae bacterium]
LGESLRVDDVRTAEFCTGDPLFTVDSTLTVLAWNEGAERLTGVHAAEAVGQRCWEILGGLDESGDLVCHAGCSQARLAREGFPVPCHALTVQTTQGHVRVHVSTIALADGRLLHVLTDSPHRRSPAVTLTKRQREVLELMANGLGVKSIAANLGIAQTTVRTYVRAILRELCSHSQLEAVAEARRRGLLRA